MLTVATMALLSTQEVATRNKWHYPRVFEANVLLYGEKDGSWRAN